jgi:carboxylesterase
MAEKHKELSPFGVLIIHGFTATLDSVKLLYQSLAKLGIPVCFPLLTGHGASSPEALRGVRWEAWMGDAEDALQKLSLEVEQVIVIGHSMGALISLNLAVKHPGKIDSLVLAAPAIKLFSVFAPGRPLHFAAPLLSRIIRNWGLKSDFSGPRCAQCTPHYTWVPTDAIISFFELIKKSTQLLGRVNIPVLIMHNRRERTVRPESASILYNRIATEPSEKTIMWLELSGHQIFCDCEREKAVQAIIDYVTFRIKRNKGHGSCRLLI